MDVQFPADAVPPGYWVPVQAVVPTGDGLGYVMVVRPGQSSAERVDVKMHETLGQLQRIAVESVDEVVEGTQVIVDGASYVQPGEAVSITSIEGGA